MEFTIDFQFINLFNIIIVWEKVIVMSQFSPKSRLKIWCTSDIQLTFSLCLLLRWSHNTILVESESNEKIGWKITLFDHKQKAFICWFVFYFPLPPPIPPQKKPYTPGKPSSVYAGLCGFSLSSVSKPSSSYLSSELFLQNPGILS